MGMTMPAGEMWGRRLAVASRTPGRRDPFGSTIGPLLALIVGCLAGLVLSWHAVLSDGARNRFYLTFTELGYTPTAIAGQEIRPVSFPPPTIDGMARAAMRLSEKPLAVWPQSTAGLNAGMDARSPQLPPQRSLQALDRLVLAEESGPAVEPAAAVGAPAAAMEIVFDINSSFLGPDAIGALRKLVSRLPNGASGTLSLQATVSDDGVRTTEPREAYRYNRWLAERRVERVRGWLAAHGPAGVAMEASFLDHDPSRRVVVAVRPAP